MRSGRLWLVLGACATTTGGVLSAYSYISPLLTDRAGIAVGLVPLVLVGFGVGSLIGTIAGGRLGDVRPYATTIVVAAVTTLVLLAISLLSEHALPTVVLVGLLGLVGLSANPVLSSLAVRFAGVAPTLGVAMSVSAYNFGTAVGSGVAGASLSSALGSTGPAVVGTGIAALTLIPTTAITHAHPHDRHHPRRTTAVRPAAGKGRRRKGARASSNRLITASDRAWAGASRRRAKELRVMPRSVSMGVSRRIQRHAGCAPVPPHVQLSACTHSVRIGTKMPSPPSDTRSFRSKAGLRRS
jgi:DHA1 family inner membrane transport protein